MRPSPEPWEVLSTRTALRDRWIDVTADAVRDARGNVLDPFYTLSYPDWVHVVAITPADELVLVRQYRHGARAWTLELPAGAIDKADTDPSVAAARELREETGHTAPAYRSLGALSPNTATHRNRAHTVLALGATATHPTAHEVGEDITVELWPLPRVLAGLGEGVIAQSMHTASLLLALQAAGRIGFELKDAP
ncbi:NUDIX hydrolase [Roseomonas nepalensis]|uniref:NUDIX hydrolase n=1 Tax=Muricoccus nepalensis TaxID=1854500 RepID=A0A502FSA2_9PROT|nr:NUDIX hydrolase [Roseomonas nepalensis]TPG52324.1 NUDIX hydrolase [Roseomonas nepalensis]